MIFGDRMKKRLLKKSQVIVLLSGGIDSAAAVQYYLKNGHSVRGLFIDYGQIVSKKEHLAARKVSRILRIKLDAIKVKWQKKFVDGEIRGRNAFLIFTALMNYQDFSGLLSIGIHSGVPYYDCSEGFVDDIRKLISGYTNGKIQLDVPFLKWNKKLIYEYFVKNDLSINMTYSCEKGAQRPCGQCQSCLDRKALLC